MSFRAMQQNALAACEVADRRHPLFCPKPRRAGGAVDALRPLRRYAGFTLEPSDSKAGAELLDIILPKGGDQSHLASSPPFFSGSPPVRAGNPVVHDARFGEDRPFSPFSPGSSSPSRKGCAPTKFGLEPAAVRIEGFNCGRRRRSHGITAVA